MIFKFRNRSIARIFEGKAAGGDSVSNPEYLPVWHVDIRVLLKVTFFFRMSSKRWGEGQAYKIAA